MAVTHTLFVALGQGHERSPSQHETVQRLKVRGATISNGRRAKGLLWGDEDQRGRLHMILPNSSSSRDFQDLRAPKGNSSLEAYKPQGSILSMVTSVW